jgi:hypothetical protein
MDVAPDAVLAALGAFMIYEQRQAFFKDQLGEFRIGLLFLQRLAKSRDAQLK